MTENTAVAEPRVAEPILEAVHVTKRFRIRGFGLAGRGLLHAVEDASLELHAGEITALVGESGSGKSTMARLLAHLYLPSSGSVRFAGAEVTATRGRALRRYFGQVQLILQDPYGSFNPLLSVGDHLMRAVRVHHQRLSKPERTRIVVELLEQVELRPGQQYMDKFPHELSGGQLQRASIARALTADPKVFLADEPVSALDVSIRLGVLNLFRKIVELRKVALLYITHDIASARYFARDISVMYAGEIIESGLSEEVTQQPAHPYTRLLIASAPNPDRVRAEASADAKGAPPSLLAPPTGCRFQQRCPIAMEKCATQSPPKFALGETHWVRCWDYENVGLAAAAPSHD